jgi:hypothetical protein
MPPEDLSQLEIQLQRFNKLMAEVMRGAVTRTSFQPWELELLIDMETCRFERRRRLEIYRQYVRAVTRQMQYGPGPPMKLSQFLAERARRHAAHPPPAVEADLRLANQ